jgi:hypothetical protein
MRRPVRSNHGESQPNEFHKKMSSYALTAGVAGVSALALAKPAEAKIIYTPAHLKIATTTYLDLNHDGINDFRLVQTNHVQCFGICSSTGRIPDTGGTWFTARLGIYGSFAGNQIAGQQPFAAALQPGEPVGVTREFPGGNKMVEASGIDESVSWTTGPWRGPSGRGIIKNGYLGLKFIVNGQTHYGWARLTIKVLQGCCAGIKSVDALLTGYAFETETNKPILAGQESEDVLNTRAAYSGARSESTVGQSSLGLLAQGAAGLVAWRREELEAR